MSHFTVMVFGENIEEQLQPFHEFECTGIDDEYIQDIDITEEKREEYNRSKVHRYKDNAGNLYSPYDNQFYRELTEEEQQKYEKNKYSSKLAEKDWGDGKGCRLKIAYLPEGYTEVEVMEKDIMSFADYCIDDGISSVKYDEAPDIANDHKYGYFIVKNGEVLKVISRTNPDAKWDWWEIGGRWSNLLKLKEGATSAQPYGVEKKGYADSALKKDIDFEGMEKNCAEKAAQRYDKAASFYPPMQWEAWESVRNRIEDIKEARNFYYGQEAIKILRQENAMGIWFEIDELLVGRDKYIEKNKKSSFTTYAFVKDGKWFAEGKMGWWGISSNKDEDAYEKAFFEAIETADPNTLITIVDCHI